jgi:hypothetical protein
MALDDDFIRDIAFRLQQGDPVVLNPDSEAWKAFLARQERIASGWSIGLFLAGLVGILFLFTSMGPWGFVPLFSLCVWFIYWWSRQIYRSKHLLQHGSYPYELRPDCIIRYHDSGEHDTFPYHELDNMVEERYGLRLERGVAWHEWIWPNILQGRSPRLLILPGYLPGYDSYLEFLRQAEARSTHNL